MKSSEEQFCFNWLIVASSLSHGFLNVHTAYYSAARVFQMEGWELRKMFKSVSTVDRVKHDIEVFSADKTVIR